MLQFIEQIESRLLFATDFSVAINFQPIHSRHPPGMLVDYGAPFGIRRGGLSYGWSAENLLNAVDRNVTSLQRNDTFIKFPEAMNWNIAVPNGKYDVYIAAGDPTQPGEHIALSAEDNIVFAGLTKPNKQWLEGSATVDVTDGRLTLGSVGNFSTDKINYIVITDAANTPAGVTSGNLKWVTAAPSPLARVEAETAVVDGWMYVFSGYGEGAGSGGFGGGGWQPSRRVDRYNPTTNRWQRMANMPIGTNHTAVAVVGKDIWLAGGYTARPGTRNSQDIGTKAVLIYHTKSNTWSTGPSLPAKRGAGGLALVNNKLYYISGEGSDRINTADTWALDLANQSAGWVARKPIPQARSHFGTAVVNGTIYVMAGWVSYDAKATFLRNAWTYNPVKNTWSRLPDLPKQRSHLSPSTFTVGTKIYMLGGELAYNVETAEVLEFDTIKKTYRKLTPLPTARSAGDAGYINGKFIYTSGKNEGFNAETYIGTFT